jgi:molecular chaperone GrpE
VSTRDDGHSDEAPKVVIRDRRRIDPETGAPRAVAVARVGGDAGGASAPAAADRSDAPAGPASAPGTPEAPTESQHPAAGANKAAGAKGDRHETQPVGGPDSPAGSAGGPGAGGDAAGPEETGGDVSAQGSAATTDNAAGAESGGNSVGNAARLATELKERTADLQRITAEYANYRRRVERDRQLAGEMATGTALTALLPVLDDMDRARAHGDLTGAFAAVAEQLVASLSKLGLIPFGEAGDPFDPTYHEAVAHTTSPDVTEPTCVEVFRKGYSLGERLLRAAMVVVADPGEAVNGGPGQGVTTTAPEDVTGPSSRSADDEDEETAAATGPGAGATGDAAEE